NNKFKTDLINKFKHKTEMENVEVKFKPTENYKVLLLIFVSLIILIFTIIYGIASSFKIELILFIVFISFCLVIMILFYLSPILNKLVYFFSNKEIIVIKKKNKFVLPFSNIIKISICQKCFQKFYVIKTATTDISLNKRTLDLYIGFKEYLEEKYGKKINNRM
ncbi:MAG: hypothetical protein JXB88_13250, partial [Spirochaetales bacterium]|nr:hypothetical protein [Spirochaetales bacterium]